MPTTDYKRDERLQVIHKCLKNNMGKWSVKKLQEKVNSHLENMGGNPVSSRTIADDLKYLAFQKGAPVESVKEGRSVFYRYSEDLEFNDDRIIDFKPVNRPFIENTFFSQHEYFNNIIGVTKKYGQKPERIIFTALPKRADYLITKPLHPSQAIIANEKGTVTFEISVIINKELISTLLSFGSDVVIAEPTALRAAVTKEHENALANYNGNPLV